MAQIDPFFERSPYPFAMVKTILGAQFRFDSTHPALLEPVEAAYGGLPRDVSGTPQPSFQVELRLAPPRRTAVLDEPPPLLTQSGAGLLCGIMDASNYVIVDHARQRALVVVSEDMLDWRYHVRYELVEFAVFVLAARGMDLLPLHGACLGLDGRGVLLLGASGAGKSTLALHGLLGGMDFVAEDAIFVDPRSMQARGVGNFLHVREDALRFIDDGPMRQWIEQSPTIRRRSGVEKYEADLRHGGGHVATSPLALMGAVFVSAEVVDDAADMLLPLEHDEIAARLLADQPYASGQAGWHRFVHQLADMDVHLLRRGRHPSASVDALRRLLTSSHVASA
ncbi:Hpr(Ser) kinase/phosphatase [Luteibacter sp. OK325]|uniref:serine kinase n=1 Tax=Luteibacter sp. OK325 TaxID=2135670 RepID=UPI000D358C93|nr:serine kinase [Luteibacter sp. OK325]PTR34893.1 Hpr(Ser) kinase/phosphatase [Luteibacter sp. OK325]